MRVLTDENISPAIAEALRAAGHDVLSGTAMLPGAPDIDVVALAVAEDRVLITEDKDFDELAFHQERPPPGLIRLALKGLSPAEKAVRLITALAGEGGTLRGRALVIEAARLRSRPLP